MKILFVSGNLCDGGAQRVIAVISSKLAELGHDVSLLLYSRNEQEYELDPKVKVSSIRSTFTEYSEMSSLARICFIRKFLRDLRPDVAVGFLEGGYGLFISSLGMHFAKIASARIDPKVLLSKKGLRAKIDMLWFRSADAVILQTTRQMRHAENTGWRNKTVIANPISERALALPTHYYGRPCRRVVMAGRLDKQKNYPLVFHAMKKVITVYPDAALDIFGKGALKESLEKMIREMNMEQHIHLRGWSQDTLSEYQKSDIYVLSSDFEGMPNALMEAMAVGLPCVSTNCDTGPEDLIMDGINGYLVPVNDAEALAQRIIDLMGMTADERGFLGEQARTYIRENFAGDVVARKWEALLEELVLSQRR